MSNYTIELPLATKRVEGVETILFLNGRDVAFYGPATTVDGCGPLLAFYKDADSVVKDPE